MVSKYRIVICIDCEEIAEDEDHIRGYIAEIIASTAASSAVESLAKGRNAKIFSATTEYFEKVIAI